MKVKKKRGRDGGRKEGRRRERGASYTMDRYSEQELRTQSGHAHGPKGK